VVGYLVLDLAERKVNGKYYYQIRLSRDNNYILENFTKELAGKYGGSRFPRRKEIVFSIKVKLNEMKTPREGLGSLTLNIEEEENGNSKD